MICNVGAKLKRIQKGSALLNAPIYFLSNIANALVPFLLLPILARSLSHEEYGQVAMFQLLVSFLTSIIGLNTVGAANRKYFDSDQEKVIPRFIGSCFYALLLSVVPVFIVFLVFYQMMEELLGIPFEWLFLGVVASSAIFCVNLRLGQWQVRKKAIHYAVLQVLLGSINLGLSIFFVLLVSLGADGRVLGQTLAPAFLGLVAIFLLLKDRILVFEFNFAYLKEALKFGIPLIPHVSGFFLIAIVDRFFIKMYLSIDSVGVYMVATQVALSLSLCADAFNKAFSPWLFSKLKRGREDEKKVIVKGTYAYFLSFLFLASTFFLFGPVLIALLAGNSYKEAGGIVGFLALGQAFRGMYLMVVNYIFYEKKTHLVSCVTFGSGFFNVVMLTICIPMYGLLGAAVSYMCSTLFMFLGAWGVSQKVYPMPWFYFLMKKS